MKKMSIFFIQFFIMYCAEEAINVTGHYLSISELESIKNGKTVEDLKQLQKTNQHQYDYLQKKIEHDEALKKFISWHCTIATTGLLYTKPEYPYIPHFFSLWELAPKKGAGITVVLLDTGVACFEIDGTPYKKHPDLTFAAKLLGYPLNESNRSGFEALVQTINNFLPKNMIVQSDLEQEVITWINEYCINNDTHRITKFFDTIACFENRSPIINEIMQGRRGIMPYGKSRFFTPTYLNGSDKKVIFEFLPIAHLEKQASHGTHVYGLINAKSVGLAPHAQCIMIKICQENGTTDKETFIRALKKAQRYNPDIVNLSLKIDEPLSHTFLHELEQLLSSFCYVVAASGNVDKDTAYSLQAYPARCQHVTFDVGSFSYNGYNHYPISSFSQYSSEKGPKFVAPGFNILSTGYSCINNQQEPGYLFLSGTSMASALMSGFVALMLSEFKKDFTKEQLVTVCHASTVKMHNTDDWHKKGMLGVLDMRTALFILHVCRAFNKALKKGNFNYNFEKKFKNLVEAILLILREMPKNFADRCSIPYDFVLNFADYCKSITKSNDHYQKKSLETTISEFVLILFGVLNNKKHKTFISVSDCLFAKLCIILLNSKKIENKM